MALRKKGFKFVTFSIKQKKILTWWTKPTYDSKGNILTKGSPHHEKDAIIADGAVRSGKTVIMSLSFVLWAMSEYNGSNFGMAGKTIGSFKRNVWFWLKLMLIGRGYSIRKMPDLDSNHAYIISKGDVENYFYIFGGKDEKSQDLVQGFTAAGFFFDEVTLMPQSFVNQCVARCSEEGSKLWFNCNPDGPFHWFKLEWIDCLKEKNAIRIHFMLEDNPSLSEKKIAQYKRSFRGIFYERFILGLWVIAEGVIYSMFGNHMVIDKLPPGVRILKKWIGVDYGQSNATVFLLIGQGSDDKLYIMDEYYHEGRSEQIQKSPSKYAKDFKKWLIENGVDGIPVRHEYTFIDPSAKGFMLQLHEEGIRQIRQADNEVLKGIELVSSIIDNDMLRIFRKCKNTIKEFSAYRWDPKAQEKGEDKPIKQFDHAMDALRYVVNGTRMTWQRIIAAMSNAA
ncbi:MAG: PBSX family phage terminase large subunit [Clostridia bacterium]|nr:PBSX family phage terminase large subunit [Clostridia bacterium]